VDRRRRCYSAVLTKRLRPVRDFARKNEANTWHYRVPALHINGGGTPTREDAQRECLDAIEFALEGDPGDYDSNT
jgi:hypothetical protein